MSFKPPIPISIDVFRYHVKDIEPLLRGTEFLVTGKEKEYPQKYYETGKGEKIVVRRARREEVDILLDPLKHIINIKFDKDFYHLIVART